MEVRRKEGCRWGDGRTAGTNARQFKKAKRAIAKPTTCILHVWWPYIDLYIALFLMNLIS